MFLYVTRNTLLDGYRLHQQRRGLAPGTITRTHRVLRNLAAALPKPLDQATTDDLNLWLDTRNVKPRSRYTYISMLATFYRWVNPDNNPAEQLSRPRLPRSQPRPIADSDLTLALTQADDRMRVWLCLAAYQGLRCIEIAGLRREDILETNTPPVMVVTGKGGHQRVLPLHPDTLSALLRHGLPRGSGHVFLINGHAPKPMTVSAYVARHLQGCGIDASAHRLRHWFGTSVYRASGHNLLLTKDLLGHANPSTTAIYAAWDQADAHAVVRGLTAHR